MQLNSGDGHVYIIAEIGINHEGDVEQCARMVEFAAQAGVDAVKLQTIDADANYVIGTESYRIFKGSELTRDETARIFDYARSFGLDVFTTAGDVATVEWVEELQPACWKISSGLMTHLPMVKYLAGLGRPILLSTGLGKIEEIDQAVKMIQSEGNDEFVLFQCVSLYPAPPESLNLSAIPWMRERYSVEVGFSDHSLGLDAAFLSVGVGATLIEKHFSLDASRPGFDHGISLEPDSLKELVQRVRLAESMLGVSRKEITQEQEFARTRFLRTVIALQDIQHGELLTEKNIGIKRPLPGARGAEPEDIWRMIGANAKRTIRVNEPVSVEDIC